MGKEPAIVASDEATNATPVISELQLESNGCVQIREDEEHYYINIGYSDEINSLYQKAYEEISKLEDTFSRTLRIMLTKLRADNINADPHSQNPSSVHLIVTPSKSKLRPKRPVPQSSSINKIILHRAKRASKGSTKSANSSKSRHLFASASKNSKQMYEETVGRLEKNLDLMTEMTIDLEDSVADSKAKKFIANEESVYPPGPIMAESSTASNTTVRTRSQARLAVTTTKALRQPTSTAKATRSRKAQPATPNSSGFVRFTDSTSKLKLSASKLKVPANSAQKLNTTPSKRAVVDLSTVRTSTQKGPNRLQAANISHNTTPTKCTRANRTGAASPVLGTPSMNCTRRREVDKKRQERLAMSEEKRKKADETKRAMLESRAAQLKEERAKRLEKVTENKRALEAAKEARGHEHVTRPMTKRNAERRAKLAKLEAEQEDAKIAAKGRGQLKAEPANGSKVDSKSKLKAPGKKATIVTSKKAEPVDEDTMPPPPENLSPIVKPAPNGINTRLDETFTTSETQQQFPDPASNPGQSTFVTGSTDAPHHENVTFAIPTGPAPSTPKAATSAALAKKLLKQTPTSYHMTPPPRSVEENYDISKYIDSDDEEAQRAAEQSNDGNAKRIPKWAQGRDMLTLIHGQFGKSASQLADMTAAIFPHPLLPVPLDQMGLPVRERYAVRSSSVNWKQAQVIDQVIEKIGKK